MRLTATLALLLIAGQIAAQQDTGKKSPPHKKHIVIGATAIGAAGTAIVLDATWYRHYRSSSFHFFNDNDEWLQVDKLGHSFTCYQVGTLLPEALEWAGMNARSATWYGAASGVLYMSVVEVMDGFSSGWGFSWGDEVADVAGAALAVSQRLAWGKPRIHFKFSYVPTPIADAKPELLGSTPLQRLLKDYNGQTYWLSFNPFVVAGRTERAFLPWLNISVGYGAWGMISARGDEQKNPLFVPRWPRERQFYLSLDIDLTRIHARRKWVKGLLTLCNFVKIPAPSLRFPVTTFVIR